MGYVEVAPTYVDGKVKHPCKRQYIDALTEMAKQGKAHRYFGIYFSGCTMWQSGDWAIQEDDGSLSIICLKDVLEAIKAADYKGYIWCSLDGPASGKWVTEMSRQIKNYKQTLTNVLIDSCTDEHG